MENLPRKKIKETAIIFFIVFIFSLIIYIFYKETLKNNKIKIVKNNFELVKNEILNDINNCKEGKKNLFLNSSCNQILSKEILINYFNIFRSLFL